MRIVSSVMGVQNNSIYLSTSDAVSGRERQHTSRTTTGNSRVVGDTGDIYYPHPDRRSRKVCPDTTPCVRQRVASTQRTKHETMRPPLHPTHHRVLAQNLGPVELPKVVIVSCEANTRVCETTGATGAMATGSKIVTRSTSSVYWVQPQEITTPANQRY